MSGINCGINFFKVSHVNSACKNTSENKMKIIMETVFIFEKQAVEINDILSHKRWQ